VDGVEELTCDCDCSFLVLLVVLMVCCK